MSADGNLNNDVPWNRIVWQNSAWKSRSFSGPAMW